MKYSIFVVAVASLLVTCTNSHTDRRLAIAGQVIEYQADHGQYVVVVPMDGISSSQAGRMARQRAAEMTVQQGNRYFVVDDEQITQVMKSQDIPRNDRFYGNMYQELMIEGDFGKQSLQRQTTSTAATYSAIRLVFTPYANKPAFHAIDACKLINCGDK